MHAGDGAAERRTRISGDAWHARHDRGRYAAQVPVYQLLSTVAVVPFPLDFFGSPLSGNWSYPISLPNTQGSQRGAVRHKLERQQPDSAINLTQSVDYGLRTLSGGQYSFQVQGFLAVDSNPAPNVIVEAAHAVQDVYAIVKQAPVGRADPNDS